MPLLFLLKFSILQYSLSLFQQTSKHKNVSTRSTYRYIPPFSSQHPKSSYPSHIVLPGSSSTDRYLPTPQHSDSSPSLIFPHPEESEVRRQLSPRVSQRPTMMVLGRGSAWVHGLRWRLLGRREREGG